MKKWVPLFLAIWVLLTGCRTSVNYLDPQSPKFTGSFATENHIKGHTFKVVTFNIEFAQNIKQAITELKTIPQLQQADVLLLQEMDDAGTQKIAEALSYHYVYYPATLHSNHGKPYGNAILSLWPIIDSEKIILPHQNPMSKRKRIAVTATLQYGEQVIAVYTTHTETFWLKRSKRWEQYQWIAQHVQNHANDKTIIGGDFNSNKKKDVQFLVESFKDQGFEWVTENTGPTYQLLGGLKKYRLDHIFSLGMTTKKSGKVERSQASDHLPVWADFVVE